MNHLLYNMSIITIILGIILFTHTISQSSKKCNCNQVLDFVPQGDPIEKDLPSVYYKNMFNNSSVWMGYNDSYKEFDEKI